MAHYNSLQSLGNNILQYQDTVEIAGIRYVVLLRHLSCKRFDFENNDEVFKKLGILDKIYYCSVAYGYTPRLGEWPEFKDQDYNAATRIVIHLFKTWEQQKSFTVNDTKESQKSDTKLLPAKCNSIKQITVQKEVTFNKL